MSVLDDYLKELRMRASSDEPLSNSSIPSEFRSSPIANNHILIFVHPAARWLCEPKEINKVIDYAFLAVSPTAQRKDELEVFVLMQNYYAVDSRTTPENDPLGYELNQYDKELERWLRDAMERKRAGYSNGHLLRNSSFIPLMFEANIRLSSGDFDAIFLGFPPCEKPSAEEVFSLQKLPISTRTVYEPLLPNDTIKLAEKKVKLGKPSITTRGSRLFNNGSYLIKSVKRPPYDNAYQYRRKLNQLQNIGKVLDSIHALPVEIIKKENSSGFSGFAMKQIGEGCFNLEKTVLPNSFRTFCRKYGQPNDVKTRYKILYNLVKTICYYHGMGIYLSDIKTDQFIVLNDFALTIVPIDCDGWCVNGSYSTPPVPEMLPPNYSREDSDGHYQQTREAESWSLSIMLFYLLTGCYAYYHMLPFSIAELLEQPSLAKEDPGAQELVCNFFSMPESIREQFIKTFVKNKPVSAEGWLAPFSQAARIA